MSNVKTAALLLALGLGGCTDWAMYDVDKAYDAVPQVATMRQGVIPEYQEDPRSPAPGSVPVSSPNGDGPAPYLNNQLDSVAPTLRNPFAGTTRTDVLVRGELVYTRNCTVCHGPTGAGNGPVVGPGKFPFAPPVNNAATAARSDGYLYAIVEAGRGLMPPYGERITHMDRWAVVEYVRALQRRAGAQPTAGGAATAPPPAQVQGQLPAAARDSLAPLNAPAPAAQPQAPR